MRRDAAAECVKMAVCLPGSGRCRDRDSSCRARDRDRVQRSCCLLPAAPLRCGVRCISYSHSRCHRGFTLWQQRSVHRCSELAVTHSLLGGRGKVRVMDTDVHTAVQMQHICLHMQSTYTQHVASASVACTSVVQCCCQNTPLDADGRVLCASVGAPTASSRICDDCPACNAAH